MEGIEPRVQPLGGCKQVDVLADEARVHLGIIQIVAGHVDQGDGRLASRRFAHLNANVAGQMRTQEVGLCLIDVNALGQNHVKLNFLLVVARGRRAPQTWPHCARPVDAEGRPQEVGEGLRWERHVQKSAGGMAQGKRLHQGHSAGHLRLGQIDGLKFLRDQNGHGPQQGCQAQQRG